MKARDLIPGWPRPRSTMAFTAWNYPRWWFRHPWVARTLMVLDERGYSVPDGPKRDFMLAQIHRDMQECTLEWEANYDYHKAQQRMVDDFRKNIAPLEGCELSALPESWASHWRWYALDFDRHPEANWR